MKKKHLDNNLSRKKQQTSKRFDNSLISRIHTNNSRGYNFLYIQEIKFSLFACESWQQMIFQTHKQHVATI